MVMSRAVLTRERGFDTSSSMTTERCVSSAVIDSALIIDEVVLIVTWQAKSNTRDDAAGVKWAIETGR